MLSNDRVRVALTAGRVCALRNTLLRGYHGGAMADLARHTLRNCPECGTEFERRAGKPTGVCLGCATKRVFAAGDQARAKAGPRYERQVLGQLRYWKAEAERLGL